MHQHQHGPNCQHGHGHSHGPSQGHGHPMQMMPGMPGQQAREESPQEYFQNLQKRWEDKQTRVFFWQELLHGVVIDRFYQRFGLDFMRSMTCQAPQMIVMGIQNMLAFEWMPLRLRPITSGLFFPLMFLLFFCYNVVVGVNATDLILKGLAIATLTLYVLVALRGNSSLKTQQMQQKSRQAIEVRPYLQNPQMNCQACGILRPFRTTHCPYCKTCIAKHSRHSLVFGSCIGAANQFLALLFFIALTVCLGRIIWLFHQGTSYGLLTKIMFYLLNVPFCWMSFTQVLQIFVFNYVYGVTQQELKMWPMLQYLQKIPDRGFQNNVDQGFCLNLQGSLMALFGIPGYESEQGWAKPSLNIPQVNQGKSYRTNWSKAMIYLVPLLPYHKNRSLILQMMQRDQPRMIQMFKMQTKFRQQVMAEPGSDQLNQFQIQQKLAMKMQQHMMKNMQGMPQMAVPSPQQQKNIQLQMLGHMKKQFASDPDLFTKIQELETQLREGNLSAIETNMQMRTIQQELMGRRMKAAMKQMESQKNAEPKAKNEVKNEEEETPMRSMADQDL